MPWPVTHILIADKVYDRYFSHLVHKEFILGTCFPDIRYPAKIERERTHINHILLTQIQNQSPFRAGLLFHSLVDGFWNAYIRKHSDLLFSVIPYNRIMFHTMKILQDGYLYSMLRDWNEIVAYFITILPEELEFGASEDMVQRWHEMLAHYLSKPPDQDDLQMLSLSLPPNSVIEINKYYSAYQNDPALSQIMVAFYEGVDDFLTGKYKDL